MCFSINRFLRNSSELKQIKNISLLRQQIDAREAQEAAERFAAHRIATMHALSPSAMAAGAAAAAAATVVNGLPTLRSPTDEGSLDDPNGDDTPPPPLLITSSDEPTDLTLDATRRARLRDQMDERGEDEVRRSRGRSRSPPSLPTKTEAEDADDVDDVEGYNRDNSGHNLLRNHHLLGHHNHLNSHHHLLHHHLQQPQRPPGGGGGVDGVGNGGGFAEAFDFRRMVPPQSPPPSMVKSEK